MRGEDLNRRTYRWLAVSAVMILTFGMAACSEEPTAEAATDRAAIDSSAAGERAGVAEEQRPRRERERGEGEHDEEGEHGEEGEHSGSEGEGEHGEGGEEGEESGVYIGIEDAWDVTRRGAKLVLSFDPTSNAFVGTVENTTDQTLCAVRVEVHLSTGTELGPTERTDLPSGETTVVKLPTSAEAFETWTAHPEMSTCSGG